MNTERLIYNLTGLQGFNVKMRIQEMTKEELELLDYYLRNKCRSEVITLIGYDEVDQY